MATSVKVGIPSSTIEAIRAIRERALRESGAAPTIIEASAPATAAEKKKKKLEYPSVLKNVGEKFSELFGEYFAKLDEEKYPDFFIPTYREYDYPVILKEYIPEGSDYKSDPELMYNAVLAYVTGSVTHVVGWPGTGKSNGLPVQIAHRLGLPLLRLSLNKKGMMLDDLIGREAIVQGEKGVETRHKDGLLCHWVEHPCIILADEFSRANPEISNGLMGMMERGGALIVENRTPATMKRHEHCWIIASDNVKGLGDGIDRFVGTDMVDGAVLDRFEVTLEVDYLPEADQAALIQQWFPGFPEQVADKLVQFGGLVQQGYKKGVLSLSFSPRALKEVARYTCIHADPATAVRKVVLAKFADESEIEALKNAFRTAFGSAYPQL